MDSRYDHQKSETDIYQRWEKGKYFEAPTKEEAETKKQKPFCIIMPPPNANDPLHVGHAMFVAIEDILIRYHRMKGEASLWLPGTDHAGIETQYVFEKKLAKDGKSRFDFGREELYQMIWKYVQENGQVAIEQMKRLGASADWGRYKFTLDEDVIKLVLETFVRLNNEGLVYRAKKLVNYCTKCGTSYSDLEVEHEEREGKLYVIDYGKIKVATTRPETMFGDVAVAVNPKDKRYRALIGEKVELPIVRRMIPVVADEMVDMEFGTGAVKITPAHDQSDWEIAERQGWEMEKIIEEYQVIDERGKMTNKAGERYEGLGVLEAREKVVTDLGDKLIEVKNHKHKVGTCYRCGRTIEPLPKSQFFIRVKPLTEKALKALDQGEVKIHGAGREKILRHWLQNLRDWNISRQIVWGIQMPIWYKNGKKDDYMVSIESPGENYVRESDTFDTWFSSGQWPVVSLKTNKPNDFDFYYPTTVMETAYDILPFWVMRMLMMGIYVTEKIPFREVYFHGLVRDEKGEKMSKSKGNVINPVDMIEKYGADALRMALVMSSTPGKDKNVGEETIRGMRNFANKIWNAARFVIEFSQEKEGFIKNLNQDNISSRTEEISVEVGDDKFNLHLSGVVKKIEKQLDQLKIGLAAETVYNEFWHWFCDEGIERAKNGYISSSAMFNGLKTFLKLLHPFVPFVTESIWQELEEKKMLISEEWPR